MGLMCILIICFGASDCTAASEHFNQIENTQVTQTTESWTNSVWIIYLCHL